MLKPKLVIIGKGKVGQSLAQLMQRAGYQLGIYDRDIEQHLDSLKQADLVLLTVNDDAITAVCEQLSEHFSENCVVAHCSGSLGSDALAAAQQRGCSVASAHPLNTFPNLASSLKTFSSTKHGTYLYAEGDSAALEIILPVMQNIGFNTVVLESAAKPAYHAACVFACNYLNVLMDLSLSSAQVAGLGRDKFWRAIQPLIESTLHNIDVYGPSDALSGPIARGDTSTVQAHLNALKSSDIDLDLSYRQFGLHALRLAENRGELSRKKLKELEAILAG